MSPVDRHCTVSNCHDEDHDDDDSLDTFANRVKNTCHLVGPARVADCDEGDKDVGS